MATEATNIAERLPVVRSIDNIVIARIMKREMIYAINELLACELIQHIGQIGPFTAEDSEFLKLFIGISKEKLLEIRQQLLDGKIKARNVEGIIDALIQEAKSQIKRHGPEFVKLQLFIDQKKAELIIKAGFLKKIAKGEEISESEANSETTDILKTEFAKAYNDTAKILLASGKLSQQEGNGDLASLQRILQGLGLSMDAESIQTLPEVLAQTTRDLFRLLQAVKAQVDETMELLITMEGRMSLLTKKAATTDILTPTPAPADTTTTKLAQENISEGAKKAMEWMKKHWHLRADAHDKRKVLSCLVQNFDKKLSTEDLEKMGCKKSKLGTSTTLNMLIKDLETRPELKDGPYIIKTERIPGNNNFATYQFTYKDGARTDSGTGTDDENSPKAQPVLDEKEKTAEAALAWIEKHWPTDKRTSTLKQMAKFLASNYGTPIPSFNATIQSLYKGKTQFAKGLIGVMERLNCPYEIIIGKIANPHGTGRSSYTYCFTAKSGYMAAQNDNDDDDDKKDNGRDGESSRGSSHGNDGDESKNNEIKAAIRESLEWIKTNKLDKRGSSMEGLAIFLASNYGTSIPSHNEKMNELLGNDRTLINRLIRRLKELNSPFQIIVGTMANQSGKGGRPSNIYCWIAK
ncbi:MAG: hypothetical protein WCT36_04275 [Candidatus Gracilibacteria bacterium]